MESLLEARKVELNRWKGEIMENCRRKESLGIGGPRVGLWWRGASLYGAACFAPCSRYALLLLFTCASYEGWSGGGLKTAPTYGIACECGQIYVGWTCSSVGVILNDHHCYICLARPVRSAVSECSVDRARTSLLFLNRAISIYYTLTYQQNCT